MEAWLMRLVLGSDLHGNLPDVPPCDVLVLAGDILPETEQEIFIENSLAPWLEGAPAKHIVATWGNHDHKPFRRWDYNLAWNLLVDGSVTINGFKFYGTPWCLPLGRWAWQAPEYLLEHIYSLIPNDTDILISHTPPYRMRDRVHDGKLAGSKSLRKRMKNLPRLKLLVCGHIHEAIGSSGGVVVNASCLDDKYKLREFPWTNWEL